MEKKDSWDVLEDVNIYIYKDIYIFIYTYKDKRKMSNRLKYLFISNLMTACLKGQLGSLNVLLQSHTDLCRMGFDVVLLE